MRKLDVINTGAPPPEPTMPIACSTGGCGGGEDHAHQSIEPGTEVTVAGKVIDPARIAIEIQNHPATNFEEAWHAAARALVVRELLRLEAGSDDDDEQALQDLLEREVSGEAPTDSECQRVYEVAPQRFSSPELVEAAHILIEPEEDTPGAWQRARLRVEQLAKEVAGDARAFAAAAKRESTCSSAKEGGALGQIRRGELAPPIDRALFALGEDEMSDSPVQSVHGFHLLRVNRRVEGKQLPYDAVKSRIRDMLEARSWAMAAAAFVAGLADKYGVGGITLEGAN